MQDPIVTANFVPYIDGHPTFRLEIFESSRPQRGSQYPLAYRFTQIDPDGSEVTIFDADDYRCSPLHSIDGPECVIGLMGFLTLRPGDTDAGYFDAYTAEQCAFASRHADALGLYAMDGDADCLAAVREAMGMGENE